MSTPITEAVHAGAFIISESPGRRSREAVDIAVSQTIYAGSVLGRRDVNASARASVAADASNTGNGVFTLDATTPVLAGAIDGVYRVVNELVATNSGEFVVYDPNGIEIGRVAVGGTFATGIKFVIADGSTDFAIGDAFSVTVGVEALPASVVAASFNVGNGAFTMDPTAPVNVATAQAGTYSAVCTAVAANAGTFTVYDPNGTSLGTVTVAGSAFNTQIKFTIADGSIDFALGDTFYINVRIGEATAFEYLPLNLSATDGTQIAAAIAVYPVVTGGSTRVPVAGIRRDAEVRLSDLTLPSGVTAAQQAIVIQQLRQLGIICR